MKTKLKASDLFDINQTTHETYKRGERIIEALESVGILNHSPAIFSIVENERRLLVEEISQVVSGMKITEKFKPVTGKYKGASHRQWAYNKAIDDVLAILNGKEE